MYQKPPCNSSKCNIHGPRGPRGPQGVQGAPSPTSFVQLMGQGSSNMITSDYTFLNLSSSGIDPMYTTGGYALTQTTVQNDTLNLIGPGMYHIDLTLGFSFTLPIPVTTAGKQFNLSFNVLDRNNEILRQLYYSGVIPDIVEGDGGKGLISLSFLYNATITNPTIRIVLTSFNYNLAYNGTITISNINLVVQKWQTTQV